MSNTPRLTQEHVLRIARMLAHLPPALRPGGDPPKLESVDTEDDSVTFGGYGIRTYMGEREVRTIGGTKKVPQQEYEVTVEVVDNGTHWDPPTVDFKVLANVNSFHAALREVLQAEFNLFTDNLIRGLFDPEY